MPTAPEERAAVTLPQLEQYEVLAPIARGGMAEVFLGRLRTRPDRLVALKIMRPELCRNQEFVSMFLDEARIASSLAHPNIAAIYGLGHDHGHHYLAMELLRGRTLLDVVDIALRKGGRIPYEIVAWIGARIADALHFAHERKDATGANSQIVHRDVNPSNIFVTFAGEPKLIDFGLAKARDRITATAHGVLKGKLAYLAPEQVTGSPIDRRSDVFALGVTLWEISVGDRLFRDDSDVETIRRVSRAEVPDPTTRDATYPRALADVVLRALKRTPNERYRTAHELAVALDGFVAASGRPVDAQQVALLVRSLFPRDAALPWETLASELERQSSRDDALAGGSLVRAWDDEAQKMTWMGVEASALDDALPGPLATRIATLSSLPWRETLESRIGERLTSMQANDAVARSRALLELALVDEWLGDGKAALGHVEASVKIAPSAVAYSALRRLRQLAGDAAAVVPLVDAEIERVSDQGPRADLFAERGRLLQVAGDLKAARASFAQALSVDADHPAALKGLEVVLRGGGPESRAKLAAHLGRMAEAYDDDPALAAWLQVERAALLDALDQVEEAKGALVRALELEPTLGPVRAACMAHATAHRDASWLVSLLLEEAALETRADRAAALELEAAALCRYRLADTKRAVTILESARGRAVATRLLRRVALDELVVLHERGSRPAASLAMRRERLPLVESSAERATELVAIAMLEERAGDLAANVAALDEARVLAPGDESITESLDLALERAGDSARRVTMWSDEAAQSSEPARRVRCLTRAADIAEGAGDPVRAIELHRAALAAAPAHLESVDALDRLLRARRSDRVVDEASARIALHRHAADHATDPERRIAHLEVAALLEEEELGDASMAASTHEAILTLAPRRRSALVALARTSRRAGDGARSARALLTEAEHVTDARERDALRVRAAEMLAATDADRAAALLGDVLEGGDAEATTRARALKRRIHERGEQWTLVDRELAAAIEHASGTRDKVDLLLARAELQRGRLASRDDALATVYAALAIDGTDPRAMALATSILDELGDNAKVEAALLALAERITEPSSRARTLLRAANLAEYVMGDDNRALEHVSRAREATPEVAWTEERFRRLSGRGARRGDPARYENALESATAAGDERATFDLALLRLDRAPESALELAERIAARHPRAPHALRLLERAAAASERTPLLANALSAQVEAFTGAPARLGALWEEMRLVEWSLGGDVRSDLDIAHRLAPTDRAALDGIVRRGLASLHAAHDGAREGVADALRVLCEQAPDDTSRLITHLALALALLPLPQPREAPDRASDPARAALREFREALRIDPRSVTAAAAAARLGGVVSDAEASVAGLVALAEVAPSSSRQAELFTQAAGAIAAAGDGALGTRAERLGRAAELLERALAADPESILAATMLVGVRSEDGARDRLLATLGSALERAKDKDAIASLGMELARAAREHADTRMLAIDALRRVVSVIPTDAAAWRALADVCLSQGARAEAAQALEAVAANARDPRDKLDALFGLVDLYRQSGAGADVDRVLRVVIDVDPSSVRALRELVALRRASGAPREDVTALVARLADAAKPGEEKSTTLTELADLQAAAGDRGNAEASLIEAAAQSPSASRLARVLDVHTGKPDEQARVLSAVVSRGEQLGRPDAAAWAMLGQLEVDSLKRTREGVAHLRRALALEPAMPEARAAMARGFVALGQKDDAASTVLTMIVPDAAQLLSLRDPGGALGVLENALGQQGRRDESVVVRELRAIAGALDDGAHVELRARRRHPIEVTPGTLDAQRLASSLVPEEGRNVALAIASAMAGVEAKLVKSDLEALDVTPRQKIVPSSGHPVAMTVQWLSRLFGIECPPVLLSSRLSASRAIAVDGEAWIAAPSTLGTRPDPEQIASLVRPLVRIVLAVPWLDDVAPGEVHAMLCGIARRASSGYGSELRDVDPSLVDDYSQRVARAVSRRQKKALSDLAPRLTDGKALSADGAESFHRAITQTELRVAFIVTGDLLATLDALRASDATLAREMDAVGPRALAAAFTHPIASDLVRFALGSSATAMRTRLGTV